MASHSITKSSVHEEALHIKKISADVKAELDDLDGRVRKLMEQWSGAAQDAYNRAHKNWNTKTDEMNQLLDRIGAKAIETVEKYGAQDAKSAGRFGG